MARPTAGQGARCATGRPSEGDPSETARLILKEAILRDALTVSKEPFTLSSGKKSHHYYDLKTVLLDAVCLSAIGELFWEMAKEQSVDAIGGMESGAIPMAVSVLRESHEAGAPLRAFFVRKKPKKHGTQQWIEGILRPDDTVMVIDDVITTGGSLMAAVERTREVGCQVVSASCVVDREEGAREELEGLGIPFFPLFTHTDFEAALGER